ncbi:hypothetical protein SLEP1_g40389 [Rubroshorea leprosula]|uniref:Uncharacterized protein n=1 Tax=Rubroshorea leprosula TaxID=152421 RepID=A0AAV5L390_9ROSI|nr:hypothetical protein SLEP1_g40389 [Rubroshorea leprosula]
MSESSSMVTFLGLSSLSSLSPCLLDLLTRTSCSVSLLVIIISIRIAPTLALPITVLVPVHLSIIDIRMTGRAGQEGCAITFISEEDARYAPDLVKALELSEQVVPDDLRALADSFMELAHGTGYGGSGFKFNEEEDEVRIAAKKAQAREYGFEEDKSDSEDEDEAVRSEGSGSSGE